MSIPVPRHDYWNRVRAGIKIELPPLPTQYKGEKVVTLFLSEVLKSELPPSLLNRVGKEDKAAALQLRRKVPEDPLIANMRFNLLHTDKRWLDNGLIWTKGKQLRVGVAPANIDRACRFMEALLLASRRRGYRIEVSEKDTMIYIGYQPLPILLRERTRRVYQSNRGYSWRGTQLVPYGVLYLHMTYQFKERDWKLGDGAIPDEAESMLDRLESASQRVDEYYRDLERIWAESAARRKAEQELGERRRLELESFKKLLQVAKRWQQAQWIREYLATMGDKEAFVKDASADRANWLDWARAKADWYDPLVEAEDEWLVNVSRDSLS
jgi:hypothetical protein